MRALRPTWRRSLRRAVARFAGAFAAFALLFAIVTSGKRYFFCAAMDRVFANTSCCAHFEPALEDRIQSEQEGAAIQEDDQCCELRQQGSLPGAMATAAPPPVEAHWVGVVPPPPSIVLAARDVMRPPADDVSLATGPPLIERGPRACARLSVFIL
jgi:hypothetical protein